MSYNDYFLRTTQALYSTMLALGERLGAIKLTYEEYEDVLDEAGLVIGRTPVGEPMVSAVDGQWSYIGEIREPTGETETVGDFVVPVTAPLVDPEGATYIHVNLRTKINLRERAEQLAQSDAEIAAALAQLGQFFLVDELGNARQPTNPLRVWL